MAITWSVEKIVTMPVCGDLVNIVTDVDWKCTATEGEASHSTYGRVSFVSYDTENFTAFDDLAQSDVIGWVKQSLGEGNVAYNEELAQQRVNAILNPQKTETSLPW